MQNPWNKNSGFTLLELLAVIAIIATASLFAMPAFQEWNAKRSFDRTVNDLYSYVTAARLQAFTKATTIRVSVSANGDNYTVVSYSNSSSSSTCTTASGWTQLQSNVITVDSNFQITGNGIGSVCFYRDGSSSGGIYNVTQKNGASDLGNTTINVVIATGFVDVTKN